jgi:shikimate kinase
MKNIYLCGFMGCGKSTVGLALARILNMEFVDMDTFIEERAGQSVSNIFKSEGEPRFRSLETAAAREFSEIGGLVVATGGGAVLSDENVAAFKSGGIIVLIDVPLEVIAARLEGNTTRPLLQGQDKTEAMRSLYNARMPRYRAVCDITITNSDNRDGIFIAKEIAENTEIKELLNP